MKKNFCIALSLASAALISGCKRPGAGSRGPADAGVQGDPASALIDGPLASARTDAQLESLFNDYRAQRGKSGLARNASASTLAALAIPHAPAALNLKLRGSTPATPQIRMRLGSLLRATGGTVRFQHDRPGILTVDFKGPGGDSHLAAVMDFLKSDGIIESVEPDFFVRLGAIPDDSRFRDQFTLKNETGGFDVNITPAWDIATGDRAITVAVIDSGIDCTHEDLAANCYVNPGESGLDEAGVEKKSNGKDDDGNGFVDDWQGWDFFSNTNNAADDYEHGTHVAGIIGAVGNNGKGIAGVSWKVKLVPLKAFGAGGAGTVSSIIAALEYAVKMGFTLTNNSYGIFNGPAILEAAVKSARDAGVFMSCSAGNAGKVLDQLDYFPATYPFDNIITVTTVDDQRTVPRFANLSSTKVDLSAPGVNVLSSISGNRYDRYTGTSMSAPHVTGALALLKSAFPGSSWQDLAARVMKSVTVVPGHEFTSASKGVLNVYEAIRTPQDIVRPSVPGNLSLRDRTATGVTISFTPSSDDYDNPSSLEATGYDIRVSPARVSTESQWTAATPATGQFSRNGNRIEFTANNLPPGTNQASIYLTVRARDRGGNDSALDPAASVESTLFPFRQVAFYDGSAIDDMAGDTPWVIERDPVRGPVFSDGVGEYPGNTTRRMTLREIPLQGIQRLALQYWTSYALEESFDFGRVFAGHAGLAAANWTRVDEVTGTRPWHLRTIDLTPQAFAAVAAGQDTLQVAFEMATDAHIESTGWLVDDISVLVNDSLIGLTGVPSGNSQAGQITLAVAAPAGSTWTHALTQSGATSQADCARDSTYASPVPVTALQQSVVLMLDPAPYKFLCVRASVPGYAGYVTTWSKWSRNNNNLAGVVATGQPSGRSNARGFDLRVVPASGSQAVTWGAALLVAPGKSPELACASISADESNNSGWTAWQPTGTPARIALPKPLPTNDAGVPVVLCVRGRDAAGNIQAPPGSYSWTGDFANAAPALTGLPDPLNSLRVFEVQIKGARDQAQCGAALIHGENDCPVDWESYRPCSGSPDRHLVRVPREGKNKLCVLTRDDSGNQSPSPVSFAWTADFTPAIATLSGDPPVSAQSPGTRITITGKDVEFFRFARGKSPADCVTYSPWSPVLPVAQGIQLGLLPAADGPQSLCVRGMDRAGNEQNPPAVLSWVQDTVAEKVKFTAGLPALLSNSRSLTVTLGAGESGTYRATLVPGTTCEDRDLRNVAPAPLSQRFTANLAEGDATYTLCAALTDNAGNAQTPPTIYTFNVDHTPPLATVSDAPSLFATANALNVRVAGTDLASYQWALIDFPFDGYPPANPRCAAAAYSAAQTGARFLGVLPGNPGPKTLCVRGADPAGNVQPVASFASWVQTTPGAPFAALASGAPASPTSQVRWNLAVTGPNVAQYQFAVLGSRNSLCDQGVNWSGFQPVTSRIVIDATSGSLAGDGYKTLCLRGRTTRGVTQSHPSIVRWLQFAAADATPSPDNNAAPYGAVTRRRSSGSAREFFDLARTIATPDRESVQIRVCPYNAVTGSLGKCASAVASFLPGAQTATASIARQAAGDRVVISLPPSGRGRLDPFIYVSD